MKRVISFILLIVFISFGISLFVDAEERVVISDENVKIEDVKIDSSIMIDNAITKLSFFKKNMNVIVTYK